LAVRRLATVVVLSENELAVDRPGRRDVMECGGGMRRQDVSHEDGICSDDDVQVEVKSTPEDN